MDMPSSSPFLTYDLQPYYIHKPLTDSTEYFRLLELCPKSASEAVSGRVQQFKQGQAPPYVAISYEWGKEDAFHAVVIDGVEFRVRPNLYQILTEYARRIQTNSFIFVDAICIDQSNLLERNAQVSCIGKIFAGAEEVSAWLSQPFPGMKGLFEVLTHGEYGGELTSWGKRATGPIVFECRAGAPLGSIPTRHDAVAEFEPLSNPINKARRFFCRYKTPESESCCAVRDGPDTPYQCLRCVFIHFSECSYWSRAWIIQEIMLSRHLSINCGTLTATLTFLSGVRSCTEYFCGVLRTEESPLKYELWDSFMFRLLIKEDWGDWTDEDQMEYGPLPDRSLRYLVDLASQQQCADLRDRVFSIVGIAGKGQSFEICYQTSRLGVFLKVLEKGELVTSAQHSVVSPVALPVVGTVAKALEVTGQLSALEFAQELSAIGMTNHNVEVRLEDSTSSLQLDRLSASGSFCQRKPSQSVVIDGQRVISAHEVVEVVTDIALHSIRLLLRPRPLLRETMQWELLGLHVRVGIEPWRKEIWETFNEAGCPVVRRGRLVPANNVPRERRDPWAHLELRYADFLELFFLVMKFDAVEKIRTEIGQ